ncbi:hypothetical protein FRC09_004536, partial [Ceratobasidium sp. 395]
MSTNPNNHSSGARQSGSSAISRTNSRKCLWLDGEEVEPRYVTSALGEDDKDDEDARCEYEDEHEHKSQYPPHERQHQGRHAPAHPAARVQPIAPSQTHECAMPMPV